MTQYLSDKLKILSLFSIILVLYIHSDFHDLPNEIHDMHFNMLLQKFISGMFGRCAVPMFFSISGYLFFRNVNEGGKIGDVFMKIKKRVNTLIVPFLIASWFPFLSYVILGLIPGIGRYINGDGAPDIFKMSLLNFFSYFYYDTGSGYPYAFHLWFLRDLIIIVMLTPIIFRILKYRMGGGVMLVVLWILNYYKITILPVYGMFWFLFGHCFLTKLGCIKGAKTINVACIFFILCITQLFSSGEIWSYVQIPIIMLGITTIWSLYDLLIPTSFKLSECKWLKTACSYTFFIYLIHEPTLNVIRKLLVIPFHNSSIGFAFSYLLSSWIFIIMIIPVGVFLKKYTGKLYSVFVGGR